MLENQSPTTNNIAGIGQIFSGPAIGLMFNLPGLPPDGDPRKPDHRDSVNREHLYLNAALRPDRVLDERVLVERQ